MSFVGSAGAALVEAAWVVKNKVANEQHTKGTGEHRVLLLTFPFWYVGAMKKAWPEYECSSTLTTQILS
jgi:hypothetical protein